LPTANHSRPFFTLKSRHQTPHIQNGGSAAQHSLLQADRTRISPAAKASKDSSKTEQRKPTQGCALLRLLPVLTRVDALQSCGHEREEQKPQTAACNNTNERLISKKRITPKRGCK
jgi:hypothetical protein